MRDQFRVLLLGTVVFQGPLILPAIVHGQEAGGNSQFVPRSDHNAAADLKSLRYALSQIRDSAGDIDPLADYAKLPDELKQAPKNPTPDQATGERAEPSLPAPQPSNPQPSNSQPANSQSSNSSGPEKPSSGPPTSGPPRTNVQRSNSNPRNSSSPSGVMPASGREKLQRGSSQRVMVPIESGDPCAPRIIWDSCVQLDAPERSIAEANPAAKNEVARNEASSIGRSGGTDADGFAAEQASLDYEAQEVPRLSNDGSAILYASAHQPVASLISGPTTLGSSSLSDPAYTAYFQEIPFGSQGTPIVPMPTYPTAPSVYPPNGNVLPSIPPAQIYPPQGGYPAAPVIPPPAITPTPPIYPPINQVPTAPVPVTPVPATPLPGQSIPITQVPVQPLPTYTTPPVYVAPAPYYVQPPVASAPTPLQTPSVSPLASNSQPPTYSLGSESVVNFKPFVSGPPRQVDARRMVSPTLFRPASSGSCNPCGPGQPTYAAPVGTVPVGTVPGAGPLTYAPPTYMPYPQPNNAGYRPLIGFGQDIRQAQLGRGIVGQPTAYMPSQPFRNFFRYIFP